MSAGENLTGFELSGSGLYIRTPDPDVTESIAEDFQAIPNYACSDAVHIITALQETANRSTDETITSELAALHGQLVSGCVGSCMAGQNCMISQVQQDLDLNGKLSVVREPAVDSFRDKLETATLSLFILNDGVLSPTQAGDYVRDILTHKMDVVGAEYRPEVTVGAWETLAARSIHNAPGGGPNLRVATRVFGMLYSASQHLTLFPEEIDTAKHFVIPETAGEIRKADVDALYDYADVQWQFWLKIANEPKGAILEPRLIGPQPPSSSQS